MLFEELLWPTVQFAEGNRAHAHGAGFGGVHEEFANDLGGVGNGDGVEVGVEGAGDDEAPEALDGAGGLLIADGATRRAIR